MSGGVHDKYRSKIKYDPKNVKSECHVIPTIVGSALNYTGSHEKPKKRFDAHTYVRINDVESSSTKADLVDVKKEKQVDTSRICIESENKCVVNTDNLRLTNANVSSVHVSSKLPFLSARFGNNEDLFLVDSGSTYSILSRKYRDLVVDKSADYKPFIAVNGSLIEVFGLYYTELKTQWFTIENYFFVADISYNIIGYDIMFEHGLVLVPNSEALLVPPPKVDPKFIDAMGPPPPYSGPRKRLPPDPMGCSRAIISGFELTGRVDSDSSMEQMAAPVLSSTSNVSPKEELLVDVTEDGVQKALSENKVRVVNSKSVQVKPMVVCDRSVKFPQRDRKRNVPNQGSRQSTVGLESRQSIINVAEANSLSSLYKAALPQWQQISAISVEEDHIHDKLDELFPNREKDIDVLKQEFADVFKSTTSFQGEPMHGIVHRIRTEGEYKSPYIYTVPYVHRLKAKERIDEMLQQGILEPSSSPYAAPLVCVPKKNGELRLCVDYRAMNHITVPDKYCLPNLGEIKQSINGKVFSTFDLKESFHQIGVHPNDREKTAVRTPWGTFQYVRMPFGLKNAPPTFQRFINIVTHGIPNLIAYVDDIIIYTDTYEEHMSILRSLFTRLAKYGLLINIEKSVMLTTEVCYIGFQFGSDGYRPVKATLPKMRKYLPPVDKRGVQKFLGIINYYRAHIRDMARIAAPLHDLTKKGVKFAWTPECQEAFEELKVAFMERVTLHPYVIGGGDLSLYTDASLVASGAVLLQGKNIVEFYSKKHTPVEQRYSTHEREALGVVSAVLHFRTLLLGVPFTVYTDHQTLCSWLTVKPVNERHARWLVKLQDMQFQIKYVKGEDNVLADLMSRPSGVNKSSYEELSENLGLNAITDTRLLEEIQGLQTPEELANFHLPSDQIKMVEGVYYYIDPREAGDELRIMLPQQLRDEIMQTIHNLGHFGRSRTYNQIKKYYYWPHMRRDITRHVMHCMKCQISKVTRIPKRTAVKFPATDRFKMVHIDIVGPLVTSHNGNKYMLTMIDRYTKWLEVVPIRTVTAENIAEKFYATWVARFGPPSSLISDQGAQFEGQVWHCLMKRLGITKLRTTAYHPQTNGQVERAHLTLKNSLRCLVEKASDWEKVLPSALLAIRTMFNDEGVNPSMLLYGESIAIPGALAGSGESILANEDEPKLVEDIVTTLETAREFLLKEKQNSSQIYSKDNISPIRINDFVWMRDPIYKGAFCPRYLGPYKVIAERYPVLTLLIKGIEQNVNIDRVKLAYLSDKSSMEVNLEVEEGTADRESADPNPREPFLSGSKYDIDHFPRKSVRFANQKRVRSFCPLDPGPSPENNENIEDQNDDNYVYFDTLRDSPVLRSPQPLRRTLVHTVEPRSESLRECESLSRNTSVYKQSVPVAEPRRSLIVVEDDLVLPEQEEGDSPEKSRERDVVKRVPKCRRVRSFPSGSVQGDARNTYYEVSPRASKSLPTYLLPGEQYDWIQDIVPEERLRDRDERLSTGQDYSLENEPILENRQLIREPLREKYADFEVDGRDWRPVVRMERLLTDRPGYITRSGRQVQPVIRYQ